MDILAANRFINNAGIPFNTGVSVLQGANIPLWRSYGVIITICVAVIAAIGAAMLFLRTLFLGKKIKELERVYSESLNKQAAMTKESADLSAYISSQTDMIIALKGNVGVINDGLKDNNDRVDRIWRESGKGIREDLQMAQRKCEMINLREKDIIMIKDGMVELSSSFGDINAADKFSKEDAVKAVKYLAKYIADIANAMENICKFKNVGGNTNTSTSLDTENGVDVPDGTSEAFDIENTSEMLGVGEEYKMLHGQCEKARVSLETLRGFLIEKQFVALS